MDKNSINEELIRVATKATEDEILGKLLKELLFYASLTPEERLIPQNAIRITACMMVFQVQLHLKEQDAATVLAGLTDIEAATNMIDNWKSSSN